MEVSGALPCAVSSCVGDNVAGLSSGARLRSSGFGRGEVLFLIFSCASGCEGFGVDGAGSAIGSAGIMCTISVASGGVLGMI